MAEQAAVGLIEAKTLDEFQTHWHEFLRRLDRVWNKAEAHYSRSPKWPGVSGRWSKDRRTDPLLVYLVQARNVEEHGIAPVVSREQSRLALNPAGSDGVLHIKRAIFGPEGFSIEASKPFRMEFRPASIQLAAVSNRGRTYEAPSSHQGASIDPRDVVAVAHAALKYYDQALTLVEKTLVK